MKKYHYIGVAVLILVTLIVQRNGLALTAAEICTVAQQKSTLISSPNKLPGYVLNPLASLDVGVDVNTIIDSNGRYVLCWDSNKPIIGPIVLNNTAQFSIVIYGLTVNPPTDATDPNSKVGVNLLTVMGSNILIQNGTFTNLRGPIVLDGAASMKDSTLSCDTTFGNIYTNAILELKGTDEKVSTTTVTNCQSGISVAGMSNTLTEVKVTYDKVAAASTEDGIVGVTLGSGNTLMASVLGNTAISGFTTALEMQASSTVTKVVANGPVTMGESAKLGASTINGTIHATGNKALITKSTLAGDPAVQIDKGLTGVKVIQNTFTKINTIVYVDPVDTKANTLFGVDWMGVTKVDEESVDGKVSIATRVVGKLLDSNNASTQIEVALRKKISDEIYKFEYHKSCNVFTVSKEDKISFVIDSGGGEVEKTFLPDEKYFDCDLTVDANQVPVKIFMTDHLRFISNTPTVSLMSDDKDLESLGKKPTIVAISQPSMPIGSDLGDQQQGSSMGDATPKVPDPSDVGDSNSNSGNNATSGVVTLGNDMPDGIAGAGDAGATGLVGSITSGGGCSLSAVGADQGQTASALVWLLALLPLPLLIPFRNSKKDDK